MTYTRAVTASDRNTARLRDRTHATAKRARLFASACVSRRASMLMSHAAATRAEHLPRRARRTHSALHGRIREIPSARRLDEPTPRAAAGQQRTINARSPHSCAVYSLSLVGTYVRNAQGLTRAIKRHVRK